MKILRLILVLCALAVLGYGLVAERHVIHDLSGKDPKEVNAVSFTEGQTTDDFMRRGDKLFDTRSLVPETAQVKDCKT